MVGGSRRSYLLLALEVALSPAAQGRRVVDVVQVGDAVSEQEHGYAAEGATSEVRDGRTSRQATGWLRYTMKVYDDSEVTVACTFRGSEGRRLVFNLVVDGRVAVTHTFVSPSAAPVAVEFRVPEKLTLAKTKITVTLRGVNGPTPSVIELRTVQEHLERP